MSTEHRAAKEQGTDCCPCGVATVCNCYLRLRNKALEDDADREMGNHFEHNTYFTNRRIGDK
ncbi:MAG TPA: hypothetical protein VHL05_15005 [Terriglobales bacterium]|jgi:hypothetical protein|nr:hypothetical protein [Terriglobales bacterium]